MQQFFNPIANILATNAESKKGDKALFARNIILAVVKFQK